MDANEALFNLNEQMQYSVLILVGTILGNYKKKYHKLQPHLLPRAAAINAWICM